MIRKQIYITQEQDRFIKELALARGVNEAEIIREALEGMKETLAEREKRTAAWAEIESIVAGITAAGTGTGDAYTWKRDDAYEDRRLQWEPRRVAEETAEYRAGGGE